MKIECEDNLDSRSTKGKKIHTSGSFHGLFRDRERFNTINCTCLGRGDEHPCARTSTITLCKHSSHRVPCRICPLWCTKQHGRTRLPSGSASLALFLTPSMPAEQRSVHRIQYGVPYPMLGYSLFCGWL